MTKPQAPNYKSFDLAQDPSKGIPSEVEGQITTSNDPKTKHTRYLGSLEFRCYKLFVICNLFIGIFTWAGVARAETIHLKSGEVVEGTIVARTADAIKVDTGIGIPITYYLDEIKNIPVDPAQSPGSDQTRTSPVPTGSPAATPVPIVSLQPPFKTPPPQQPAPSAARKTGKELELYARSTLPPWQAPRLSRDEYLKAQIERARALEKKVIRQAIRYLVRLWQEFKDAHPSLRKVAEGPAGVPVGAGLWAGVYALICFPLARIARRLQADSWMAWVPILQIFLVIRIADKSPVWFLFFCFPGANLFAFLFAWMSIARRLEQSHRLGYLMLIPGVNVVILWYLAFLPVPAPPKPQDSTDTGIRFE